MSCFYPFRDFDTSTSTGTSTSTSTSTRVRVLVQLLYTQCTGVLVCTGVYWCTAAWLPARSDASQESCQPGVMPARSHAREWHFNLFTKHLEHSQDARCHPRDESEIFSKNKQVCLKV